MEQAISQCGVNLEALHAQMDAQALCREYGQRIKIRLRDEDNITRDSYNSIKVRPSQKTALGEFGAYPVQYQPSEKQLEKAGLREKTDVAIYIPVLDISDLGFGFADIDIKRSTVILDGEQYEIRDKARSSQFAGSWLYYTLGLSKR